MRILAVAPVYWPSVGGGERLLATVLERMVLRGHSAEVITADARSQPDMFRPAGAGLPRHEMRGGVNIRRLAPGGPFPAGLARWLVVKRGGYRLLQTLTAGRAEEVSALPCPLAIAAATRARPADVVLTVNWWSAFALEGTRVAARRGIPVVALPLLHVARPWANRPALRPRAAECAWAVGLTPSEAAHLRTLGAPRTEVIGCGIDPRPPGADGVATRRRLGLGDRAVVGFVGRQDEGKGAPTLVAAMRLVWRHAPEAVLLFAGQSANRDRATREALGALAPAEHARVVSVDDFSDSDAPDLFAACDLLAQPSVEESFGLVLIEAWTAGRPVIGADIPATRDLIDDGVDGRIVPPADPQALAGAILGLLASPDGRAVMGENGRAKVLARHTTSGMVDAWETLLSRAAGGR